MNIKKINRGLVLGGILIVGITGKIVYSNITFDNEKDNIKVTVDGYLNQISEINLDDNQEIFNNAMEFVSTNWKYDNYYEDQTNKNTMIADISYVHKMVAEEAEKAEVSGEITKCDYSISDLSIKKNGDNGAVVTFNYDYTYEYTGSPVRFDFGQMEFMNSKEFFGEKAEDSNVYVYSGRSYYNTVFLLLDERTWKIVGSNFYLSSDPYILNENEVSDDEQTDDGKSEDSKSNSENADSSSNVEKEDGGVQDE